MSDTPRTEAEVNRQKCWSDDLITIDANFACQLERELNAANDRIKRLEKAGDGVMKSLNCGCPHEGSVFYCQTCFSAWDAWRKAKEAKL